MIQLHGLLNKHGSLILECEGPSLTLSDAAWVIFLCCFNQHFKKYMHPQWSFLCVHGPIIVLGKLNRKPRRWLELVWILQELIFMCL